MDLTVWRIDMKKIMSMEIVFLNRYIQVFKNCLNFFLNRWKKYSYSVYILSGINETTRPESFFYSISALWMSFEQAYFYSGG